METKITGRGVKVTDSIRDKVDALLDKHQKFLTKANKVDVELKESIAQRGVDSDLEVELTITMPKVIIRVEESGDDFYTIIDEIDPILRRRLVRYRENKKRWEGIDSWRIAEERRFNEEINNVKEDIYADAVDVPPVISRYKQFAQNSPMHPAEAIERMELLGHEAFLFKNIETKKYAVVYSRRDGTYGLLEPKNG